MTAALGWTALGVGVAAIVLYFVLIAMRPRLIRLLNGSGLFFTGLGLIQASIWLRDGLPGRAGFNADAAVVVLCLAALAQGVSAMRNRKSWDGTERRLTGGGFA